ncbi:hypothetical protein Tco_1176403 [Tanacetum coccineum]
MRTRNSYFPNNSNVTIPRRRNRNRAPNIVEPELPTIVAPMVERTMKELLRAPTKGYGEAIVLPEINADHFEIKTNLLQLVQANPFYGRESENPHAHINSFKRITSTLRFRNTNVSRMNATSSKTDERIDRLADQLSTLVEIVSKKVVTHAPVKAVEESCVTCGGAHSCFDQPPQYFINHPKDLNQQRISDVHVIWDKLEESHNEILNMVRSFCEMVIQQKLAANISTHTPEPSRHFNFTYDDDDDDEEYSIPLKDMPQISPSIALAPVSSIMEPEDSLTMGDEHLSTISEKESDEFIKSSVEDLVPIPSESEDILKSDSDCVLPSSDDFSPIFEEKSKDSYNSNPDELTFLVTPLSDSNEDECLAPRDDVELLLHHDPSISIVSILEEFTNEPLLEENDDLFDLESKEND